MQGNIELVDRFLAESGYELDIKKRQPFVELNQIVSCLRNQDLEPALAWCQNNRVALIKRWEAF